MAEYLRRSYFTFVKTIMHEKPDTIVPWKDARVWLLPLVIVAETVIVLGINGNKFLFAIVNTSQPFLGDSFWLHITVLGDSAILLVLLLPFVGKNPRLLWHMVLAALLATIVVLLLKNGLGLPRPFSVLGSESVYVIGPELSKKSFPSGHTAAAFTILSVLWLRGVPITLTLSATILVVLIGYSRIVVGAHWPLDVAAGALFGWLAGVATDRLAFKWQWGLTKTGQLSVAILLVVAFFWVMLRPENSYSPTRLMQYSIAIISLLASLPGLRLLLSNKNI